MGDSVSSTAVFLPYSALAAPNSRSIRGISSLRTIPTTVRTREILPRTRIRNGGSQLITACSRSNEAEMKTAKSRVSLNINRHPIPSGSGEYDLYDEFGFEEKEKKQIDFEPTPDDKREKKIDIGKGTKASSGVKFVQFKEENYAKSVRRMKDEELVRTEEGSDGVVSELEELERRNGAPVAGRRGRQLMKRSSMLAKQVISMQSALSLGFVSQLWVDTASWVVLIVEVRPNLLSGEPERFFLEDVSQVGDVVLIQDESVIENDLKMVGLETLVGYNVVTRGRRSIGKVRGYTFNINSGAVESLELDSFGISIVPSSLVSTYALLVEDVLEVVSDTIVVHQAAASCMQRLTKGFWDPQKLGNSVDELGEHSDFERQPVRQDQGRNRRRDLFLQKVKETADEWELPMDYL